ncbi:MAG: VOC family protein [Litorimonas sp.]
MAGYHHLALAVDDMAATHDFYEGVMGWELVKVEVQPVMTGGWAKHFFYRMDEGDDTTFIAFWELHGDAKPKGPLDLNKACGTPPFTQHVSFDVGSLEELKAKGRMWQAAGCDVIEVDHNWCHSVYTTDPTGNVIEFCLTTGEFTQNDRSEALAALEMTEFVASPPPRLMRRHEGRASPD